jgi:hypothetical protein
MNPGRNTLYEWAKEVMEWSAEFLAQMNEIKAKDKGKDVRLPYPSEFARSKGIPTMRLINFAKQNPQLKESLDFMKDVRRELLVYYGLNGKFHPASFIFTGKNDAGMSDKVEHENTGTIQISWEGAGERQQRSHQGKLKKKLGLAQD